MPLGEVSSGFSTREMIVMTEREFNDLLKSLPREKTEKEVEELELRHDREMGPWTGNQAVHHCYGESRQA